MLGGMFVSSFVFMVSIMRRDLPIRTFSRTTDISLSNYFGRGVVKSDATDSNAPSMARVVLFERPVQTLLMAIEVIRKSNILRKVQRFL